MTTTLTTLLLTTLLGTLFSGCASKNNPAIACFKGSSSCITQQHSIPQVSSCPSCHATT